MSDDLIRVVIDDAQVKSALDRLLGRSTDMSAPFRQIAGVMGFAVEENFAQEGRPPWIPWAPSTANRRSGGKILQDTGRLAASITTASDALSATMGTNTAYAAIHQFGGQAGRNRAVTIPARPFLALAADDTEEIMDILGRYIGDFG
ncbi:hypothetical protein SIID45300_01030 [Candidatus Magnetaquicoccaceae bacterium FCR-1]|uniref:Phage virion morphogenesis protein n=1 Tax=Candidatus Magnetaquiglobus chichijimensis TaxID=3141448 RepID=A0ABQ0C753_9PROT